MAKLVAFCGAKESGKSTSAELFRQAVNAATEEVAFAGHLKKTCAKVFKIDIKYFLDTKLKEAELENYVRLTKEAIEQIFQEFDIQVFDYDKHIRPHMGQVFDTPRKILQYVGTEVLHPLDKNIHVNITLKKLNPEVITVATDLRFPQEFDALKDNKDFIPVYVNNKKAEDAAAADTHASEQGWKQFKHLCIELDNNGTMSDLIANVNKFIKEKL